MSNTLHDEAESIAIEQCAWWRAQGVRPAEAFAMVGAKLPAGETYRRIGWDDVHYAVARAWMAMNAAEPVERPTKPRRWWHWFVKEAA